MNSSSVDYSFQGAEFVINITSFQAKIGTSRKILLWVFQYYMP